MVLMYDPPEGWKYGFPKPFKREPDELISEVLLRDGYPQELIDEGMAQYTRFREVEDVE